MAQNVYDQENFFKEYIQLPRQVKGLDGAPEWSALKALIPDPKGSAFLDLGCGFGWVCRWARENGATTVQGVDVSDNMLSKARGFPPDAAITYTRADLETFEIPPNTYDIVFSSLTLHYLKNLPSLILQISKSLKAGGAFMCSVEHPIFTSPRNAKFVPDSEGQTIWPLDGYLKEGPRTTNWFADGVVKQHRTISTYVTLLLQARLQLSALDEWGPTPEQIKESPQWADELKRPPFLLLKGVKAM
ncbi:related to SAM-dependent methyltransferases [Phialocephala subalpina]|uniref:Related to SAM-dependent methyltransferases n=1 Tax=Phialocephala subalpina TaxID=576137 RepID=A0A1L7WGT3_9HELO|nr:related to SAM-dependent methyltransferases [Phialocephala subalpina]